MNPVKTMLAVFGPLPVWANFLIMFAGIIFAGVLGALVWFVFLRKKRKRKHHRKQHQHEKFQRNPTLGETGGLPPRQKSGKPPGEIPPP